ncbi:regulatory factor X-associated protein-like isoform X1 [Ptychodera flava]|uniref:regulatory factor X-associated protein-like isoform X1 n=1 Tax=Ptychodera flava TaxID=63121 RepID=UPI00396AA0D0
MDANRLSENITIIVPNCTTPLVASRVQTVEKDPKPRAVPVLLPPAPQLCPIAPAPCPPSIGVEKISSKKEEKQYPRKKVKRCSVQGCEETTYRYKSDPWMCKYHKNKSYKEAAKRRKELKQEQERQAQAQAAANAEFTASNSRDSSASTSSQSPTENECQHKCNRTGRSSSDFTKYQPHVSMLEQVLNEKKLALMRSPEVVKFLQNQQKALTQAVEED